MGPRTYYGPIVQENVLVRVLACVYKCGCVCGSGDCEVDENVVVYFGL